MSRLGKRPILIPDKTEVTISEGLVSVKGPKGELKLSYKPNNVAIEVVDGKVELKPANEQFDSKVLWGTYASHIRNMVEGVNNPYEKKLLIEGVGYKWEVRGKVVVLNIGFSHPVEMEIPEGLTVTAEKNMLTISGIDKEMVGQFSAKIRSQKKPEPYKGKGIRYEDEVIRRKEGKKSV